MAIVLNPFVEFPAPVSNPNTFVGYRTTQGNAISLPTGSQVGDCCIALALNNAGNSGTPPFGWSASTYNVSGSLVATCWTHVLNSTDISNGGISGWTYYLNEIVAACWRGPTTITLKQMNTVSGVAGPMTFSGITKNVNSKVLVLMSSALAGPGTVTAPGTFTRQGSDSQKTVDDCNPSTGYSNGTSLSLSYPNTVQIGGAFLELT